MRGTPANVRQGRMAAFMPVARLLATGLLVACAPAGCRATLVPPDGQDPARVQVQALERKVAALEARNAELGAQLDALRAQTGSQVPEDVLVATPRLVGVSRLPWATRPRVRRRRWCSRRATAWAASCRWPAAPR
jgi:hypothetical protein